MTVSVAQAQLFFLALTRILAMIIHVPVLGGTSIPTQIKLGLGVILAVVLIPWQPLPPDAQVIGLFGFTVAVGREILIGTLAGFAAALTFAAIQIAGEAMGLESGFASSHVFNPAMSDSGSSYHQLFILLTTIYFLIINGHHMFIIAMARTFQVLPVNSPLPSSSLQSLMLMTSQLITSGIQLALPIMAALIMTDLTLGLLARVAPQVQVYFLGLPVKVGLSLLGMGMMFTVVLPFINNLYQDIGTRMLRLLVR